MLAVMADRQIRGATVYKTLLIWPYAVAPASPACCGCSCSIPRSASLARLLRRIGFDWNPLLNGNHAMMLIMAAAWKQISYNFLFFVAGLQSIPKIADRGGGHRRRAAGGASGPSSSRCSPTTFFLLVVNIVYAFFDTFGIIDAVTGGGPGKATETLVYKVYNDGFGG
jgi:sn-glycerol 3-phosphate transport system permease protein